MYIIRGQNGACCAASVESVNTIECALQNAIPILKLNDDNVIIIVLMIIIPHSSPLFYVIRHILFFKGILISNWKFSQ